MQRDKLWINNYIMTYKKNWTTVILVGKKDIKSWVDKLKLFINKGEGVPISNCVVICESFQEHWGWEYVRGLCGR